MKFALPQLLWLLLLVPLLAVFLLWAWRAKERLIAQFVQSRLLAQLTVGVSKTRQQVRLGLLVVAVGCAVLAMARPQWGFTWEEVSQKGLDIVVAIDTSRSMLAADIPPNRLERAKLAALDLMKLAKNDRLGLVAFAGSSFLQCPLTLDEEAFRQGIAALDVNIIPQGGTAIGETIQTALAAFKDGDNHKVLVLFTDGEDHESGVLEAAQAASTKGLRIFTIGIGTATGELIRVADAKGKVDFLKDDSGNVVKSKLNETLLQQIAGAANGFYLNLRGANTMDVLYERGLAPLPKSEFNAKLMQRGRPRPRPQQQPRSFIFSFRSSARSPPAPPPPPRSRTTSPANTKPPSRNTTASAANGPRMPASPTTPGPQPISPNSLRTPRATSAAPRGRVTPCSPRARSTISATPTSSSATPPPKPRRNRRHGKAPSASTTPR